MTTNHLAGRIASVGKFYELVLTEEAALPALALWLGDKIVAAEQQLLTINTDRTAEDLKARYLVLTGQLALLKQLTEEINSVNSVLKNGE